MPAILVFRDTVGARSESFVERQYAAFDALRPIYIGSKRGPAAPKDAVILAPRGVLGWPGRILFRQFGHIPATLDHTLKEEKPALIHAQFGLGGALALPVAEKSGLPLVVTFHGGDATKDKHYARRGLIPTIFQRRRAALIERAALILCVSSFVREALIARGFPPRKLEIHTLGVEIPPEVVLPPVGVSNTVLFVGRLVEKKGVDTLIDAFAIAIREEPALELVILGDGPHRAALEKRAEDGGIKARFGGWAEPSAVQSAMRRALTLVVPSRTASGGDSEGLPTVLMEAMALGLPVVATRHAGIPEIVSDGVTGLLVPEADPVALAAAMVAIKRDPERAGRMRGEAFADVRARFDARRQSEVLQRRLLAVIAARAADES